VPTRADTFSSYVNLELETTNGQPDDDAIADAVELMISTYNELSERCGDEFDKKMVDAVVESVSDRRRRLSRGGSRELQNLNVFLFLRVSGTCNGCGSNRFFFNQVNRRKLIGQCEVSLLEDFLSSYNVVTSTGNFDSIVGAANVEDVAKPAGKASSKGKKGGKQSKITKTSTQGMESSPSAPTVASAASGVQGSSEESSTARNRNGKGRPTSSSARSPTKAPTRSPTKAPTGTPTNEPTSTPTGTPTGVPTRADTFSSYVNLELETTDGQPDDDAIADAVELMISTYNELNERCGNPFDKKMVDAVVESVSDRRRRLGRGGSRELQNLNIFLFLRVSGTCNGCGSDRFFFNQVNRRKLIEQCEVPLLEDFLSSYNVATSTGNFDSIVGALSVEDVAQPSGKAASKSSKKSQNANTSTQGMESSPSAPTVASAPSGPSTIVTGAGVEAISFDPFTSFIEFTLETTSTNLEDDDVENAVDLMISTYNEEIESCDDPFDRRMVDAVVESIADGRRQLTRQASRGLQNLNVLLFLRVSGTCNGCGSNRFFFNQVNRRKLFDKNDSADLCEVPKADIFLAAYSARLESGDFGSIVGAISIKDVAQPSSSSMSSSKGSKGSGGSSMSSALGSGGSSMSSAKGSGGSSMSSAKGSGGSGMSSAKGASSGVSAKGKSKGMTNKRSHESTSKTSKKEGNR
jgi:Fe-S cluster biogenesis protein NfuA/bacterioferritin-associated ferredoxin